MLRNYAYVTPSSPAGRWAYGYWCCRARVRRAALQPFGRGSATYSGICRHADRPGASTTAPIATANARVAATPVPTRPRLQYTAVAADIISPIVVEQSPARGEALAPDGLVKLVFDRPMNRATVEQALSVSGVQGTTAWSDARTVSFTPATPWTRDAVYDVVLGQEATAEDGAVLGSPYQFRFTTAGFLDVAQVIPAQGTTDTAAASVITVVFNRPVVALTSVAQMAQQPQPLRLMPDGSDAAVAGTGEWLNTSVYVFRPTAALEGGTRYIATVDAGITDTEGSPLREAYRWEFTVAEPQVLQTLPEQDAKLFGVDDALAVTFNQPAPSSPDSIRLITGQTVVAGNVGTVGDTLYFTPTQRLAFDTVYTAEVRRGVRPHAAVSLAIPYRAVAACGQHVAEQRRTKGQSIRTRSRSTSMRRSTPRPSWTILSGTPALSETGVYTYYNDYDRSFTISFDIKPSADYRVRIGPNIADPYGNTTGQTLDVGFRTDALPPLVQMVVPGQVGTYDANRPTQIVLRSVNKGRATLALYRVGTADVINPHWYDRTPSAASLVRRWSVTMTTALNEETVTRVDLVEGGGKLAPGAYLVALEDTDPQDSWQRYHTLVVSELNMTLKAGEREALVWVNRLSDGAPAANIPIFFYSGENKELGKATTDATGIARITFDAPTTSSRYAFASEPYGAVGDAWGSGISPYDFGVNQTYGAPPQVMTIYTDRPIYRPGQVVHFKGVLRNDNDGRYSLPAAGTPVNVVTRSPDGTEIARERLVLNGNGTFFGSVTLPEGAMLGQYFIGDDQHNVSFTVAAYRAPEFEVKVVPSAPETVRGNALQAQTQVRYFFGGPVVDVPVEWHVLAEPYRFEPAGFERYTFTNNDDPWQCFYCWWRPLPPPTPILTGTAKTDAQGNITIPVGANLRWNDGQTITTSVRLQFEATASGKDNAVLSGRGETIVHQAGIYTGLATASNVATAAQPVAVDMVSVASDGTRRSQQRVEVTVERREWTNRFVADANGGGEWQTDERRIAVTRQTVTTDARGEAVFRWTPDQGGSYQVTAQTSDGTRTSTSSIFLWVTGSDNITWRQTNDDQMTLISDRTQYKPGDTASILIPSPFDGPTWALVTVERGGILKHEVVQLASSSTVYKLPITAEHAPNIYVSVMLFTGPSGERRTADQKVGLLPLKVDPVPQTLTVNLTT